MKTVTVHLLSDDHYQAFSEKKKICVTLLKTNSHCFNIGGSIANSEETLGPKYTIVN